MTQLTPEFCKKHQIYNCAICKEENPAKKSIRHMCLSVSGALRNWTKNDWDFNGAENGITGSQLKERFRILEFQGVKVLLKALSELDDKHV